MREFGRKPQIGVYKRGEGARARASVCVHVSVCVRARARARRVDGRGGGMEGEGMLSPVPGVRKGLGRDHLSYQQRKQEEPWPEQVPVENWAEAR